ncbi:uncharacterized protein LTR77_005594 [Saxophila tyrrhenica]|uniref:Major facilitator superfamily (MFS) profile domain-containing protein n=1 Tax=Saxophila tyrrhenica TaxID=1690608 RepID=A0AAV9P9H8_9PEZI|nr:hypothetical protein LTR77_005594 [Saxophila tyrrhenica]
MVLTQPRGPSSRDPDKFPAAQLFLLALVRVAEPIALTSIFPYAWKLVLNFHVGGKDQASFYAGILISAFALAESITGMYWGGLSDKLGRKPVLIMGCFGTIASLLVVGFSMNFWMALFGRMLGGALNGNIGVVQTMVGELVVNPKHEPKAYAVMPFVWSVGTIVGPSIGGYFATPVDNFLGTFSSDGLFGRFPYLLPNLICAGLMGISIISAWLCLEETHPDKQPGSAPSESEQEEEEEQEFFRHFRADSSAMTMQASDTTPGVNLTQESYGTFNAVSEDAIEEEWDLKPDGTSRTPSMDEGTQQKWLTKRVIMLTIALGIFTYHSMTYDHLLPIFCQDDRATAGGEEMMSMLAASTANRNGSLAGGLGFSIKDVGFIMTINGAIALFVQGVIFPVMASLLGVWKTFLVVSILHPIAYFIVPFLTLLPPNLVLPGLYACLAVRNCLSILAYPVLLILIKEASPGPSSLGKINGLAASTGAACRTIASPVAGMLYGIGIQIGFTAIAWWGSALVAAIGAIQALTIARNSKGDQHHVRPVAPCRFMGETDEQRVRRKRSVVHIRVSDSGYASEEEERTPLMRRENV